MTVPFLICVCRLEHLWLVVLFWSLSRTLTTWTSWTFVIATWATVTSAVITTWTVAVLTTWTLVSAWLALWLYVTLRLLDKSLA